MGKPNRKCICCGELYEYCGSCKESTKVPTWKTLFDSENCNKVFYTVSDYLAGEISEDIARMQFEGCDLSKKEFFTPTIQDTIKKVMGEEVKTENVAPKATRVRKTVKQD